MSSRTRLTRSFAAALLLAATSAVGLHAQEAPPDVITVAFPSLLPEGIEYDPTTGTFLLSSSGIVTNDIQRVSLDGAVTTAFQDENLAATLGLHVDSVNNRLLAVNMDPAVFTGQPADLALSGVAAFDLETGETVYFAGLGDLAANGMQLLNDVTSDAAGNVYVTDSFSPTIYKVAPDGTTSIFLRDDGLAGPPAEGMNIALNGIDYHPDGYLLVASSSLGSIIRVPLDSPQDFTSVAIDAPVTIDGMILTDENTLVAATAQFDGGEMSFDSEASFSVSRIVSEDGWQTATIAESVPLGEAVTTVALADGEVYGIQPQFTNPIAEDYTIVRLEFEG